MSIWNRWGFSRSGWRSGARGEYWVLAQATLFVVFALLPVWPGPQVLEAQQAGLLVMRVIGVFIAAIGAALAFGAVRVLGRSLTPLPHPTDSAELVQSGVYRFARHPIYGGVLLLAAGIACALVSLVHGVATLVLLAFFAAKAKREEAWLAQRFAEYPRYAARTKRFIPFIF
jgi:protein-S-isoprenylcysteine O-methyltransferase Ste14